MNKKTMTMVLALVLSVTLFAGTALATGNHLEGYELLKDVMAKDYDHDAGSMTYDFRVTDNGDVLFEVAGDATIDSNENALITGIVGDGNITKAFEATTVDDTAIFHDVENNLYYEIDESAFEDEDYEGRHGRRGDFDKDDYDSEPMSENEERLLDALVGDMKNKVVLKALDNGDRAIELALEEDDIPMVVNLMLSIAAEEDEDSYDHSGVEEMAELKALFPFFEGFDLDEDGHDFIKSDVKVLGFTLSVILDENDEAKGFSSSLVVEGRDEEGNYHVLEVAGSVTVTSTEDVTVEPLTIDGELILIDETTKDQYKSLFDEE